MLLLSQGFLPDEKPGWSWNTVSTTKLMVGLTETPPSTETTSIRQKTSLATARPEMLPNDSQTSRLPLLITHGPYALWMLKQFQKREGGRKSHSQTTASQAQPPSPFPPWWWMEGTTREQIEQTVFVITQDKNPTYTVGGGVEMLNWAQDGSFSSNETALI